MGFSSRYKFLVHEGQMVRVECPNLQTKDTVEVTIAVLAEGVTFEDDAGCEPISWPMAMPSELYVYFGSMEQRYPTVGIFHWLVVSRYDPATDPLGLVSPENAATSQQQYDGKCCVDPLQFTTDCQGSILRQMDTDTPGLAMHPPTMVIQQVACAADVGEGAALTCTDCRHV